MSFPVALQLYSVRDAMGEDFAGTIKKVKEMGYDYVEFAGYFGKTAEEVKAMIVDKLGVYSAEVTETASFQNDLGADSLDIVELIMDFEGLEYVSSAGLRVILKSQKIMNKQGSMKIVNVNDTIMEVFDITGFADVLTIE